MMDANESSSCVPPGFRFHPTDEELVGYYLRKKIAAQKIDLNVIRDIDLYKIEPWDLQEKCGMGYEEQKEWYFFSHKDKKYPTGTRTNRATMAGFWKATGRDKPVYDKSKLIGMRKTLVFYRGRAPNGHKTDWIMHEYRLESENSSPPQEEGWVVCRAFKKRMTCQAKTISIGEGCESSYFYDEPSGVIEVDNMPRQLPPQNFMSQNSLCMQETETVKNNNNLISLHSDQFVQLPQLESPTVPLMKRTISSVSLVSENNREEDEHSTKRCKINKKVSDRVTDWRALDKFVASQLSHDIHEDGVSSYEPHNGSDLGMLLLHGGIEEGPKLDDLLSSSWNRDIGICILDK